MHPRAGGAPRGTVVDLHCYARLVAIVDPPVTRTELHGQRVVAVEVINAEIFAPTARRDAALLPPVVALSAEGPPGTGSIKDGGLTIGIGRGACDQDQGDGGQQRHSQTHRPSLAHAGALGSRRSTHRKDEFRSL